MKKKKNSLLPLFALVLALAALLISALSLAAVPEDQRHLIDDLYARSKALEDRMEALEEQLDQLMTAVNLQSWTLDVTPWADSTGADVTLTAVPSGYQAGVSATLLVTLEDKQVQSVSCYWDGNAFTATVALDAADGYGYYCLLTAPNGTQRLPLATPDSSDGGSPVYLQSGLSAYCNLVVNDWIENPGTALVLTDGYAQVQLPRIYVGDAVQIASSEVVLRLNGTETIRVPIKLDPSEVDFSFDLTITDLHIPMPELEEQDALELSLEVSLTDGRRLNALGITWQLNNGKLTSAVG